MNPVCSSVIAIEHLSKRYGRRGTLAVRDVNLEVRAGEVFGFLGLNGAGKTTTIRVLLDLIRPTDGRVLVFGRNCQTEGLAVRAAVGYLPGEVTFYGDMTGRRVLDLLDRLSAKRADATWKRELLDRFALSETDLDKRLRDYSAGTKRKLGLVQAFQSDPALLVLDEPTEGLDPLMQAAFHDLLDEARRRGKTVFMSSHVLSEVERSCDRIGVLRRGELGLVAPVSEVLRLAPRRVHVTFETEVTSPGTDSLGPHVEAASFTPRRWSLNVHGPLGPFLFRLGSLPVADLEIEEAKLEDVIVAYYKGGEP